MAACGTSSYQSDVVSSSAFMDLLKRCKTLQIQLLLREIGVKYSGSDEEKLRAEARDSFMINSVTDFNVGITGQSGVGKSSTVNGICGYALTDPRAAKIDIVECGMKMERYPHPFLKHLVLYDLPGAGTKTHPMEKYFCDKRLYVFDCLLLVMAQRVYQVDLAIAKLAQEMETQVVFVRNKAMDDLNTMRRKHPDMDEAELVQLTMSKIKENIIKELDNVGIQNPTVFVVEALTFSDLKSMKFDELALIEHVYKLARVRGDIAQQDEADVFPLAGRSGNNPDQYSSTKQNK